jgi:DNA-binding transcriptional LysR family regulator
MRLASVDTHLVVALHALLSERSVTRAARRTGVTQPSMSHALARLRAQFDDPLLVQVGREMTLTARARALVEPTAAAIARLEQVFAPSERFDPARARRRFQLAATDNLELLLLPGLARTLAAEAPDIELRCRNLAPDWPEQLRRGELDLKLGRGAEVPPGCRSQLLARETLVCVLRSGHPAARRRLTPARYAELDHLVVSPLPEAHGFVDRVLAEHGLQRRTVMTVSHFLVAPFIVAGSDLVLTTSGRVAATMASRLGLVVRPCPVVGDGYTLTMLWADRHEDDDGHRWLRQAVVRAAGERPAGRKPTRTG